MSGCVFLWGGAVISAMRWQAPSGRLGGRVGRRSGRLTGTSVSSDINSPCTWESGIITRRGHTPWNGSAAEIWGSVDTQPRPRKWAFFFQVWVVVFVWDTAREKEQEESNVCVWDQLGLQYVPVTACYLNKTSPSLSGKKFASLKQSCSYTEENSASDGVKPMMSKQNYTV